MVVPVSSRCSEIDLPDTIDWKGCFEFGIRVHHATEEAFGSASSINCYPLNNSYSTDTVNACQSKCCLSTVVLSSRAEYFAVVRLLYSLDAVDL